MRTLEDLVNAALEGQKLDAEEVTYAFLALNNLLIHLNNDLFAASHSLATTRTLTVEQLAQSVFERQNRCMKTPPKEWIGWNNDPANAEVQARRHHWKAIVRNQLH